MDDKQYTEEMVKIINRKLKNKQAALIFDKEPTNGSDNPVTSDGIKKYVDKNVNSGTTYRAGSGISINGGVITNTAQGEAYSAGENIQINNGVISSNRKIPSNRKAVRQYLDKTTSTWSTKTWNGLTNFNGYNIWTDGDNIYWSDGLYSSNDNPHYVLDKATSTWSVKTWNGLTRFVGGSVWTDGDNIYLSTNRVSYILDKATSTWNEKIWNVSIVSGEYIWTDGNNIYYSYEGNSYVLDKTTSTWNVKTWNVNIRYGSSIWTDGDNIYYSHDMNNRYVLNKSTIQSTKPSLSPSASEAYVDKKIKELYDMIVALQNQ